METALRYLCFSAAQILVSSRHGQFTALRKSSQPIFGDRLHFRVTLRDTQGSLHREGVSKAVYQDRGRNRRYVGLNPSKLQIACKSYALDSTELRHVTSNFGLNRLAAKRHGGHERG